MFAERIAKFRTRLEDIVPYDARDYVLTTLDLLYRADNLLESGDAVLSPDLIAPAIEAQLEALRETIAVNQVASWLGWCRQTAERMATPLTFIAGQSSSAAVRDVAKECAEVAAQLRLRASAALDAESLRVQARGLIREAETARDQAVDAAGEAGEASLATYFGKYAEGERVAANIFRGAAIAAIVVAAGLALFAGRVEADDWTGLASRLALLAGVGALAAYLGRQAGQHRRMFNWARSVEVQLQSFPAFIQAVPEGAKEDAYRALAQRVLSPPPDRASESSDTTMPTAQVLDLATQLLRKNAAQPG